MQGVAQVVKIGVRRSEVGLGKRVLFSTGVVFPTGEIDWGEPATKTV